VEIGRLRAEVKRLEAELVQARKDRWMAEAAAEALGKASALLQVMLQSAELASQPEGPVCRCGRRWHGWGMPSRRGIGTSSRGL
jgi:hypothetical protein